MKKMDIHIFYNLIVDLFCLFEGNENLKWFRIENEKLEKFHFKGKSLFDNLFDKSLIMKLY